MGGAERGPGPGRLTLFLPIAFAMPALPMPAARIDSFAVLLPWYRERGFLILASLAIFVIAYLTRIVWRHNRRAAFLSRHDRLTGLPNRTVFEAAFQQAISMARAEKTHAAMILLDLDRFKPINDTLGHAVGDLFLQEVSNRLKLVVRRQDTLARFGGDEFAILMPGVRTRADVELLARNILHKLREPYFIDQFELAGSASIGISLFPEHGEDAATLHRLADLAMYRCKAQNKDQYAIFDAEVNRIDFRSAEMAGLIREALDHGYFRVYYQPLRTPSGEFAALEALVRIEHPRYGSIPPGEFITVAEDTGLIARVGTWVLREACAQMVRWRADGHHGMRVNVNVSALQIMKSDFAESVQSVLFETGLDPYALTLEITETAMMRTWAQARDQMEQLRSLGINIALDDFGTGYSTLNSLQLLPLDYVKIDRSFTARIDSNADGWIVIRAIVELAHKLGYEVIAEGVESPEQLVGLKLIGCDLLQGFLLGAPLNAHETGRLLDATRTLVAADESLRSLARWTSPAIQREPAVPAA
jgi:diguanylate cyclase (GGDEF)-like protein